MPSERELELPLADNRVNAAKAIRLRVGCRVEKPKCVAEIGKCLAVGPASLRPFSGQDRVVDERAHLMLSEPAAVDGKARRAVPKRPIGKVKQ